MRLNVLVQNQYNPLIKEYIKEATFDLFGSFKEMIGTDISFTLKDGYKDEFSNFLCIAVPDNMMASSIFELEKSITDILFTKYKIPSEGILFKLSDNDE